MSYHGFLPLLLSSFCSFRMHPRKDCARQLALWLDFQQKSLLRISFDLSFMGFWRVVFNIFVFHPGWFSFKFDSFLCSPSLFRGPLLIMTALLTAKPPFRSEEIIFERERPRVSGENGGLEVGSRGFRTTWEADSCSKCPLSFDWTKHTIQNWFLI